MIISLPRIAAIICCASAAALAGCAAGGALSQGYVPTEGPPADTASINLAGAQDYKLSPEEAEFECKKLAGLVQIRILEVRSGLKPEDASIISQALQSTHALLGGPTSGLDASAEQKRQVAQLVAYNKTLADKNCRSFDLAKALASADNLPSPTVAPKTATH